MPFSPVTLWLMRSFEGSEGNDAQLDIKRTRDGYTVHYTDKTLKCNDVFSLKSNDDLMRYLDVFTRNIIADRDGSQPFYCIQYIVPGFPATVIRREDLNNYETYDLFCETLQFYMRYSE